VPFIGRCSAMVGRAQSLYLRSAFARALRLPPLRAQTSPACGVRWHSRKKKVSTPNLRAQAVKTLRESPLLCNRSADQRAVIGSCVQNPKQGHKGLKPFKILIGPGVSRRVASPIIQFASAYFVPLSGAVVGALSMLPPLSTHFLKNSRSSCDEPLVLPAAGFPA